MAHHLDGAVCGLGDGRRLASQHGPGGHLRGDGVGLAGGATRTPVAPIDFHDTMPRSTPRTRQAGAIAAGAFDAERLEPPVCLGPRDQGLAQRRDAGRRAGRRDTMTPAKRPSTRARRTPIQSLDDLQPDPLNANRGTDRGREALRRSLRTYGAGRSIVIDTRGRILGGGGGA